jgi:hypothetical protein
MIPAFCFGRHYLRPQACNVRGSAAADTAASCPSSSDILPLASANGFSYSWFLVYEDSSHPGDDPGHLRDSIFRTWHVQLDAAGVEVSSK